MKRLSAAALAIALTAATHAQADGSAYQAAAPALGAYTQDTLNGNLWQRPGLAPRDRSFVTVATLIARNQADDLPAEFTRALDNGVTPLELAETVTHLAFYAGWGNAASAVDVVEDVFEDRGIDADALSADGLDPLPFDEAAWVKHRERLLETYGGVSKGVVDFTTNTLFRDLWLRPGLKPRDRSLVTVSALIAMNQGGAFKYHLGRAMDNGLTKDEASEVLTQAAFYAGWPNVFAVLSVAGDVFKERADQ